MDVKVQAVRTSDGDVGVELSFINQGYSRMQAFLREDEADELAAALIGAANQKREIEAHNLKRCRFCAAYVPEPCISPNRYCAVAEVMHQEGELAAG